MNYKKIYIYGAMLAGILTSCTDKVDMPIEFLDGHSKTPIAIQTNLSAAPVTRAFDKTFEENDQLFAYIEAGKLDAGGAFEYEGQFMWKGNFILSRNITTETAEGVGNITSTTEDSDLSPTLFWDDLSSTEHDLRKDGRGIRLKYGYCYNGGEANATYKNETDGTLTWTVLSNQTASDGSSMKHSDLLYAKTQSMITYGHDPASRGTLTLPYTHAMSKITINVTTGEGYSADNANFSSSVLTLKDMQIKADVNAPAATVTAVSTAATADITTFTKNKTNTTATYQAIIGPTSLTAGNILAAITNIDGNNYNIPLTSGILSAWSAENKMKISEEVITDGIAQVKPFTRATIDGGKGYTTKPGIHYILDVKVDKQKITIRATITDWESVKAEGKAAINFTGDVTETGAIADELKAKGFDVYKSSTNDAFSTKSTTVKNVSDVWTYAPVIYWAGQSDASFFRAISPADNSTSTLAQGTDLLWGTSGNTAIEPRTGDVPLNFDHLMSKLCINLETTDNAAAVNLEGATIKITNLATDGTFNIVNGSVSAGSTTETMLSGKPSGFTEYVVPQTIGDDARLIITLADGTTYSLQLNQCVDTNSTEEPKTPVKAWTSGNFYNYTIYLEKEKISFRALVKEWDEKTGQGSATLEWD